MPRGRNAKQDRERLKALEAKIDALITENPRLNGLQVAIPHRHHADGLQIQII